MPVGIGTTEPSFKLDVVGDVNVSSNNFIRFGGGYFAQGNGTSYSELYAPNGSDWLVTYDNGFYEAGWHGQTLVESDNSDSAMIYHDWAGVSALRLVHGGLNTFNVNPSNSIQFGTGGQNIAQGTFDNGTGGNKGISLNCAVGYELNWQGGHLSSSQNSGATKVPIIVDSTFRLSGLSGNGNGVVGVDNNGLLSWSAGGGGGGWSLTGNAGTDPATNFIGTTDDVDLIIKRNNVLSGIISGPPSWNTSFGYYSLSSAIPDSATFCTAIGIGSQLSNQTGIRNTSVGGSSLQNVISGYGNTAIGAKALQNCTTCSHNNVLGVSGLENLVHGEGNMAIGNDIFTTTDTAFDRMGIGHNITLGADTSMAFGENAITDIPKTIVFSPYIDSIKLTMNGSNGKVLTYGASGYASWQGGVSFDSIALTGATVSLSLNTTKIVQASGTITSVTFNLPSGNTNDFVEIENSQTITTLTITGTGTGTISAAKLTNTKTAGLKTFHNYGGNWY
jgi:hypothetical protein